MTDLRTAAEHALEALELAQTDVHWELHSPTRNFLRKAEKSLRAALAQEPCPPSEVQTEAEKIAYAAGWWAALERAHGIGGDDE